MGRTTLGAELAVADFDRDGNLDIATGNSVLLGRGDGTIAAPNRFAAAHAESLSLISADFDGDGSLDLASSFRNDADEFDDISVFLGRGDGSFAGARSKVVGGGIYSFTSADFDADGSLDLAVAHYRSEYVSVLLGRGDGTFVPPKRVPMRGDSFGIVSADFDGDGDQDLAVSERTVVDRENGVYSGNMAMLLNNGDGSFDTQQRFALGDTPQYAASADLNGDGRPDIAAVIPASDAVSVLLNATNASPQSKADCKNGGYREFGFKNQGRCIAFINKAAYGQ
jgi:hypothetical protein